MDQLLPLIQFEDISKFIYSGDILIDKGIRRTVYQLPPGVEIDLAGNRDRLLKIFHDVTIEARSSGETFIITDELISGQHNSLHISDLK